MGGMGQHGGGRMWEKWEFVDRARQLAMVRYKICEKFGSFRVAVAGLQGI